MDSIHSCLKCILQWILLTIIEGHHYHDHTFHDTLSLQLGLWRNGCQIFLPENCTVQRNSNGMTTRNGGLVFITNQNERLLYKDDQFHVWNHQCRKI